MSFGLRKCTMLLLAMLVVISANQTSDLANADDGINVAATYIREYRNRQLIEDPKNKSSAYSGTLTLTLRLSGDDMAKATRIGKLKWSAATDNNGKSLGRGSSFNVSTTRMSILRRATPIGKRTIPDTQHDISVSFRKVDRSATSIQSLKGELTVRTAKTVALSMPMDKLESFVGKELEIEGLKKQGVTIKVERYSSKSSTSLRLRVTGEQRGSYLEAQIVDGKGKKLSTNSYGFEFRDYTSSSVSTFKKLPEGSQLKLVFETDPKDFTVAIDLKDIPLP